MQLQDMRFGGRKAVLTLRDHASVSSERTSKCRGLQGGEGKTVSVLLCPLTQLLQSGHSTDLSRSAHPVDTLPKKHWWRR